MAVLRRAEKARDRCGRLLSASKRTIGFDVQIRRTPCKRGWRSRGSAGYRTALTGV